MANLLVIDDEPSICWGLKKLAESIGHSTRTAASAEQGLKEAARTPKADVIFLDVRLPGRDGLSAMSELSDLLPDTPIVVMTAHGELETAVTAIRNGAFEYLTKPFDLTTAERLIDRALKLRRRGEQTTNTAAVSELQNQIIGHSPAMQEVFKQIALVAGAEASVLVTGERGTGKELVARAIHRFSRRGAEPFVPVHVAALSPTNAESELFGHIGGAFVGEESSRIGLLEQAHGGTFFLDEVADIPMPLQVKLLRAIEQREIVPVGSDQPRPIDVRLISATHEDLQTKIADGTLRPDLYFRLASFQIPLPRLRERGDDILELAEHFIVTLTVKNQLPRPSLSAATKTELTRRPWHGNVRELLHAIEHALIIVRGGVVDPEHLPPPASPAGQPLSDSPTVALSQLIQEWAETQLREHENREDLYEQFLNLVEPSLLRTVVGHELGQCAAAARKLGLHRHTLRKKLDQYGIE